MPLCVNVGLSRKASRDYQSTGVSINVTAELDQALLARPDELQRQIDGLYAQAESAIERQVQAQGGPGRTGPGPRSDRQPAGDRYDRHDRDERPPRRDRTNGQERRGNGRSTSGGAMTQSQRRAIEAIARRLDLDPVAEVRSEFGLDFEDLSVREASRAIDYLKSLQPARNGNGDDGR